MKKTINLTSNGVMARWLRPRLRWPMG